MAVNVKIPIKADGNIPLICSPGATSQDPKRAIIALCGCLCCATGNECLHDFMPWGSITARGGQQPVDSDGEPQAPRDVTSVNGRPEGYQVLGRRFDILYEQTNRSAFVSIRSSGARDESEQITTVNEHRVRVRIAPFGLSDEDFLARYQDAENAPGDDTVDTDTAMGWVRADLDPVIDHSTGQPVLEVWVNPDRIVRTVRDFRVINDEVERDTLDDFTVDNASPEALLRIQNNALGAVNPSRCDGVYFAPNRPALAELLDDGTWFTKYAFGGNGLRPDLPIYQQTAVFGYDEDFPEIFRWEFTDEATLAGWELLARGGSMVGGMRIYGATDTSFTVPLIAEVPGSVSISAQVDYGDQGQSGSAGSAGSLAGSSSFEAHAETYSFDFQNEDYRYTGSFSDSGSWSSRVEMIEACTGQDSLPELQCVDPRELARAAIACDIIGASQSSLATDIVGYDPDDRPEWGMSFAVTFPIGTMPGDEGSETFTYWPTQGPTLRDAVSGVWSADRCPEPMLAIACDTTGDLIAYDAAAYEAFTTCLYNSRRWIPTGEPAPGALMVEIEPSDDPCPPANDTILRRCLDSPVIPTGPLTLVQAPARVRVEDLDVPVGVRAVVVLGAQTEINTLLCTTVAQFVYERDADQVTPAVAVDDVTLTSAACSEIETKVLSHVCRIDDGNGFPGQPVEPDIPAVLGPVDVRRAIGDRGSAGAGAATIAQSRDPNQTALGGVNPMADQLNHFGGECCG